MGELKGQTLSGIKWSAIERFSIQGISFLIGLILARLLTPADFGLIGMLGVFMAISQTFIDSGFGSALIRKLDRTEEDFCTVFYFNIAVSALCYAILFITSPYIAGFFGYPMLKDILRVISINLCINSFNTVQYARFSINIDFKTTAKCSLLSTVISGLAGIAMAYCGMGVWSLVCQQITAATISTLAIWHFSTWRPRWMYSWNSFRQLFGFGGRILCAGLLHTVYSQLTALVIGKFYTPTDLGYYSKGETLATLPCSNFTGIIQRVTYPILSRLQNDESRLAVTYRKYLRLSSLVMFFAMSLLATLANQVITLLLTDKWIQSAIFTQILCFAWMFDHICNINLNVLYVKGRADLILRLEVIKKTISITMIVAAIPFGVVAICISRVIYTQIAIVINTYYVGKLLNLGYWTQFKDYGAYLILSLLACLPALAMTFSPLHPVLVIVAGSLMSLAAYIGMLKLQGDEYHKELWGILKTQICNIYTRHGNNT